MAYADVIVLENADEISLEANKLMPPIVVVSNASRIIAPRVRVLSFEIVIYLFLLSAFIEIDTSFIHTLTKLSCSN